MSRFPTFIRMAALLCCTIVSVSTIARQEVPAQNRSVTVSGTITDAQNNEPLAGVTVQVKGEQDFVTTSDKGVFTIQVRGAQSVLVFSYAGYAPKEMTVGNQTSVTVTLAPRLAGLNEVVVV